MRRKIQLISSIIISNFKRLAGPYKAIFALTYRCNLRCKICKIWEKPVEKEMKLKEIEKIFKSLKYLSWLDLTGGEITIREDLLEITDVIIKNSKRLLICHISTNGQLPHRIVPLVRKFLKSGVIPVVNIGIKNSSDLIDLDYSNVYSRALDTFRILKKISKGYYYLSYTLSDYSIDSLENFFSGLRRDIPGLSTKDLHLNIFYNSTHYFSNQNISGLNKPNLEKSKEYMKLYNGGNIVKKFLEYKLIKTLVSSSEGKKFPLKCQALRSFCFISPYGEIYPCTANSKIIGRLEDYGYNMTRMWNEKYALKNKTDIENCICRRCMGACEVYPALLGDIGKALWI